MYEKYRALLDKENKTSYQVSKEAGVTQTALSNWKAGRSTPTTKTLQKIADYFGVTVDYLISGKNDSSEDVRETELPARDERDIAKDLDRIMSEIKKGDDGPLYYNGVEIDDASINLLQNAIEYALRETKKENKVKYNPRKNQK